MRTPPRSVLPLGLWLGLAVTAACLPLATRADACCGGSGPHGPHGRAAGAAAPGCANCACGPGCCGGACAAGQPGGPVGPGPGARRGHGPDAEHAADHATLSALFAARDRIRRTVTALPDGIESTTETDDPALVSTLREHVRRMTARLHEGRPIHRRDPLFDELFRHGDAIDVQITELPTGLTVRETSRDPWVAKLVQAHAAVVDAFIANGPAEMRRDHPLPPR